MLAVVVDARSSGRMDLRRMKLWDGPAELKWRLLRIGLLSAFLMGIAWRIFRPAPVPQGVGDLTGPPAEPGEAGPGSSRTQERSAFRDAAAKRHSVAALAEKIKAKANFATQDHLSRQDDPPSPFPYALLDQAAELKPAEIRELIRSIAGDSAISPPNRSVIVAQMAGKWVENPGNRDPRQVRPLLETLFSFVPDLGPGWDALPLTAVMARCAQANPGACVDFTVEHWADWPGQPHADGAAQVRSSLLSALQDATLKARLEALPGDRK